MNLPLRLVIFGEFSSGRQAQEVVVKPLLNTDLCKCRGASGISDGSGHILWPSREVPPLARPRVCDWCLTPHEERKKQLLTQFESHITNAGMRLAFFVRDRRLAEPGTVHRLEGMEDASITDSFSAQNISIKLDVHNLSDFTPAAITTQIPELKTLVETQRSLLDIAAVLTSTRSNPINHVLADRELRARLLHELETNLTSERTVGSTAQGENDREPQGDADSVINSSGGHSISPIADLRTAHRTKEREPAEQHILDAITDRLERAHHLSDRKCIRAALITLLSHFFFSAAVAPNELEPTFVIDLFNLLNRAIGNQLDEILHHPIFQRTEAVWRGASEIVEAAAEADPRDAIYIDMVDIFKGALLADFERARRREDSFVYKTIYTDVFDAGGVPCTSLILDYDFGPDKSDLELLSKLAWVAAAAHTPIIAAANPELLGVRHFSEISDRSWRVDYATHAVSHVHWREFRRSETAQWVGLTLPRFLLRYPYRLHDSELVPCEYVEQTSEDRQSYLWGNASFAFANRLVEAFVEHRPLQQILGHDYGICRLRAHVIETDGYRKLIGPTEVTISFSMQYELASAGLIPLVAFEHSSEAAFFCADSTQSTESVLPGHSDVWSERTSLQHVEDKGTLVAAGQLPFRFLIARLAQSLKVVYRCQFRGLRNAPAIQSALGKWLGLYIHCTEPPGVPARRQFRSGRIEVRDLNGWPGIYTFSVLVEPEVEFMGSRIIVATTGRLD